MHPWRGRSRPVQATLPVDNPDAVIGERHPQMVACETFLGQPIRKFDGVKAEGEIAPRAPWARAWLTHLRRLDGVEDAISQGERYVLDGLVWHLEVDRGEMVGVVLGSQLYAQRVSITPISREREAALIDVCRDRVGDVTHVVTGRLPREVFTAFTDPDEGLFPEEEDISYRCSCSAGREGALCKHIAAVLLGFVERLERRSRELFTLRGTDPQVLKGLLPPGMSRPAPPPEQLVPLERLGDVFDLALDSPAEVPPAPPEAVPEPDPLEVFLGRPAPPPPPPEPEEAEPPPPAAPAPAISPGRDDSSWLDDDWDEDDDDDMDSEVFGGGGAPSPVSLSSDAEGEEVLEIGRADLLELGIPSHRIQRWLADGTLLRTRKRGRYQLTPEAWAAIEPLLDAS